MKKLLRFLEFSVWTFLYACLGLVDFFSNPKGHFKLFFRALFFFIFPFLLVFSSVVDFLSQKLGKLLLLTLVLFGGMAIFHFWTSVYFGMKNEAHPIAAIVVGVVINFVYPVFVTSFFTSNWEWKELITVENSVK
jgi:hypothetical protein